MSTADTALVLNVAATWAMLGLSLYGHRVTYASLDRYARADYPATEAFLQARTAPLALPLMLAESGSAIVLLGAPPVGVPDWQVWLGAFLVAVCAASTAFLQVPLHKRLATGFEQSVHRQLVRTNRVRVVAWVVRGVLVAVMLGGRLSTAGGGL